MLFYEKAMLINSERQDSVLERAVSRPSQPEQHYTSRSASGTVVDSQEKLWPWKLGGGARRGIQTTIYFKTADDIIQLKTYRAEKNFFLCQRVNDKYCILIYLMLYLARAVPKFGSWLVKKNCGEQPRVDGCRHGFAKGWPRRQ